MILLAASVVVEAPELNPPFVGIREVQARMRTEAKIVHRYFDPETRMVHVYDFSQVAGLVPRLAGIRVELPTVADLDFVEALAKIETQVNVEGVPCPV